MNPNNKRRSKNIRDKQAYMKYLKEKGQMTKDGEVTFKE